MNQKQVYVHYWSCGRLKSFPADTGVIGGVDPGQVVGAWQGNEERQTTTNVHVQTHSQFRLTKLLWGASGAPEENPCKHSKNLQIIYVLGQIQFLKKFKNEWKRVKLKHFSAVFSFFKNFPLFWGII